VDPEKEKERLRQLKLKQKKQELPTLKLRNGHVVSAASLPVASQGRQVSQREMFLQQLKRE